MIVLLSSAITLPLLKWFHQRRTTIVMISLMILAFWGGMLRFGVSQTEIDEGQIQFYNGMQGVELYGVVSNIPDAGESSTQIELSAEKIRVGNEWNDVSGTVLIFTTRFPEYSYGDVLLVNGELISPEPVDGFDYPSYLGQQGIYSLLVFPDIDIVGVGEIPQPLGWVYSLRGNMSHSLERTLPEPQASLAQAVTLGIRGNIPPSIREDLNKTGTAHLLAISGLHLSILTGIILAIGMRIWGKRYYIYIWVTMVIIWVYALIAGMNPPVVRAAIMVSVFLVADLLGRQRSVVTALAFTAAVMIAINPQILWMTSFQMSFTAMLGLVLITPLLLGWGRRLIAYFWGTNRPVANFLNMANDSMGLSLGAVIGVGPLIAFYFGIVSFVGVPATMLTLPALPGAISSSAFTGLAGLFSLTFAQFTGWLAWFFLSYILFVTRAFSMIPSSSTAVSINTFTVLAYYVGLAIPLFVFRKRWRLNSHANVFLQSG